MIAPYAGKLVIPRDPPKAPVIECHWCQDAGCVVCGKAASRVRSTPSVDEWCSKMLVAVYEIREFNISARDYADDLDDALGTVQKVIDMIWTGGETCSECGHDLS